MHSELPGALTETLLEGAEASSVDLWSVDQCLWSGVWGTGLLQAAPSPAHSQLQPFLTA